MYKSALFTLILILFGLQGVLLAQDIYVYPNKKLVDQGLLEYRRFTLNEAQAFDRNGSFNPFLPLAWGPERRLTEQENVYRARVVTAGDSIFCAYTSTSGVGTFFIQGHNSGDEWQPYAVLIDTARALSQKFPEIVRNGSDLLIGFMGYKPTRGFNPGYYRSTDLGQTWSGLNEIFPNYRDDLTPDASVTNVGNRLFFSYCDNGRDSIYVLRSTDWGNTWNGRGINVAYLNSIPQPMIVRASGNYVHLVWVNEDMPVSCRYSRSTNSGQTWSEEIDIAQDSLGAQLPYIAVQDTHIVVCWMGYKNSPNWFRGDMYIRQSFDSGATWDSIHVLTDSSLITVSSVYIEDSLIVATWEDYRFGQNNIEVMARMSSDYGQTWSDEERLSYGPSLSYEPIACKTEDKIHILWGDIRPDAPGLYYCVNDPSTKIVNNEPSPPNNIYINSYPNPFNARTIITYNQIEGGDIRIYDIAGRLVRTLEVNSPDGQITWDASDNSGSRVSSGIYFVRARSEAGVASAKIVYLR